MTAFPSATAAPAPAARARVGVLVVFAMNGFSFASLMARVPDIKSMLVLEPAQLGLLLLGTSTGALCGLPLATQVIRRVGAVRAVRLAAVVALAGLFWAGLAATLGLPVWTPWPGLFLLGLGNGVWDVTQNLEGTLVEQAEDRAIMPWFHAAFSGGTVAGAVLGAGLVALQVPIPVHLGAIVLVAAAAVWWATGRFLPGAAPEEHHADAPAGPRAWTEPRTLLIGVMVLAAAFTEGTANDWLAVAFVDGHALPPALGVVALAVFLAFMTLGRVLGTKLLDRHGRVPVLRILFGCALVGCGLVVFGTPPVAFVGAAIWGLGASLGFPVGMSAAADDPVRAPARISVVSMIGYLAFLGGPPLLGLLGNQVGVLRALLVVAVVSVAALLVVPAARPLEAAGGASEPRR